MLAMKIIFLNTSLFSQGSAYSFGIMGLKDPFFFLFGRPMLSSMEQSFHGFEEEKDQGCKYGEILFFF